jgi:hypothetical protein
VKPKSRSVLVAPLAMPSRPSGTALTAAAVTEEMASAKPKPTNARPGTTGHSEKTVAVRDDSQKSPSAMRANPVASIQRGLTRGSRRIVSGTWATVSPLSSRKASTSSAA